MPTSKGPIKQETTAKNKWIPILVCLVLVVLTVAAFWQLKDCGFINFDDDMYVYENAYVQSGLNGDSVKQAFSFELAQRSGHWHPVTWLSWLVDHSLFGLNPTGYHLFNLLLHILNTVLLFLILRRMTRALWPSAFVAALFAIHPLHVESVAWITERKDVLSTFFMMLTLGAYSYYVENREWKRYVLVLLFFTLGLMSKSMLVTVPFVLLLLDYWPLNRFSEIKPAQKVQPQVLKSQAADAPKKKIKKKQVVGVKQPLPVQKPAAPELKWSRIYPLIIEKIPLFALSILAGIMAYIAAQKVGTVRSIEVLSLPVRIGNAFVSYVTYIGKMILPINLAVLYPHPGHVVLWQVMGAAILLIAITAAVILKLKKSPYLAMGWFWYLGTLAPVIGFVQVGAQAMADRYTYIPMIGLFIIVAWGIAELSQKWKYRKEILAVSSTLTLLVLALLTWKQVGYWQSSITLYDHTLKVTENNGLIHNNRGFAHYLLGNYSQAITDYSAAIAIKPGYAQAHHNRGIAYCALGEYKQAIVDFNRAIELKPDYAEAFNNRGKSYSVLGDYRQAVEDINKAIAIKPDDATYYYNSGVTHFVLGNSKRAIDDFSLAIRFKPDYANAYNSRGAVFYSTGNYQQAVEDCSKAVGLKPDFAGAYNNRGLAYAGLGDKNKAVSDFKTAAGLGDERAKNVLKHQGIDWEKRVQ